MSITIPDEDVPKLRKIISRAVQHGVLPDAASGWLDQAMPDQKAKDRPAEPKGGTPKRAVKSEPSDDEPGEDTGLDPSLYAGTGAQPTQFGKKEPPASDMFKSGDPFKKKAKGDGEKAQQKPPRPPADMPNMLPHPKDASVKLHEPEPDSDDSYRSPFGALGSYGGASSWDAAAAAQSDPDSMPRAGGAWGKMRRAKGQDWLSGTPFGPPGEDDPTAPPAKPMKFPTKGKAIDMDTGLRKKQKPFDISQITGDAPKKKGILSRIFGKKDGGK